MKRNTGQIKKYNKKVKTYLLIVAIAIFTVAFILSTAFISVFGMLYTPSFYTGIHESSDTATKLNLSSEELRRLTQHLIDYFSYRNNDLQINVTLLNGFQYPFFTADELSHMVDVKNIFTGLWVFIVMSLAAMITLILVCIFVEKYPLKTIMKGIFFGSLGFLGFISVLGIIVAIDFNAAFTIMHMVLFPQGNWTFSTSMVTLLPNLLFNTAAYVVVGVAAGATAALLGTSMIFFIIYTRKYGRHRLLQKYRTN